MVTTEPIPLPDLPTQVGRVLTDFVTAAQTAFANDLRAVVLFGSAAEGRLRATSDVNLLIVLSNFHEARAGELRSPLRVAQAAIRLSPMFILEAELPAGDYSLRGKILRHPPSSQSLGRTGPVCRRRNTTRDPDHSPRSSAVESHSSSSRSLCDARPARRATGSGNRRRCRSATLLCRDPA